MKSPIMMTKMTIAFLFLSVGAFAFSPGALRPRKLINKFSALQAAEPTSGDDNTAKGAAAPPPIRLPSLKGNLFDEQGRETYYKIQPGNTGVTLRHGGSKKSLDWTDHNEVVFGMEQQRQAMMMYMRPPPREDPNKQQPQSAQDVTTAAASENGAVANGATTAAANGEALSFNDPSVASTAPTAAEEEEEDDEPQDLPQQQREYFAHRIAEMRARAHAAGATAKVRSTIQAGSQQEYFANRIAEMRKRAVATPAERAAQRQAAARAEAAKKAAAQRGPQQDYFADRIAEMRERVHANSAERTPVRQPLSEEEEEQQQRQQDYFAHRIEEMRKRAHDSNFPAAAKEAQVAAEVTKYAGAATMEFTGDLRTTNPLVVAATPQEAPAASAAKASTTNNGEKVPDVKDQIAATEAAPVTNVAKTTTRNGKKAPIKEQVAAALQEAPVVNVAKTTKNGEKAPVKKKKAATAKQEVPVVSVVKMTNGKKVPVKEPASAVASANGKTMPETMENTVANKVAGAANGVVRQDRNGKAVAATQDKSDKDVVSTPAIAKAEPDEQRPLRNQQRPSSIIMTKAVVATSPNASPSVAVTAKKTNGVRQGESINNKDEKEATTASITDTEGLRWMPSSALRNRLGKTTSPERGNVIANKDELIIAGTVVAIDKREKKNGHEKTVKDETKADSASAVSPSMLAKAAVAASIVKQSIRNGKTDNGTILSLERKPATEADGDSVSEGHKDIADDVKDKTLSNTLATMGGMALVLGAATAMGELTTLAEIAGLGAAAVAFLGGEGKNNNSEEKQKDDEAEAVQVAEEPDAVSSQYNLKKHDNGYKEPASKKKKNRQPAMNGSR